MTALLLRGKEGGAGPEGSILTWRRLPAFYAKKSKEKQEES